MVLEYKLRDLFAKPDGVLEEFGIEEGFTVADIGCGPGRYLKRAAELVGKDGRVYAVDIHETAIRIVRRKVEAFGLANVVPVLNDNGFGAIPAHSVDVAFALDMFHAVEDPAGFLREIRGVVKETGVFLLEDGHQSRESTREKVLSSGVWRIDSENERYLKLIPEKN